MLVQRYTVVGTGKFSHIIGIRQGHNFVTETWTDTSEDRDVAGSVAQAKKWLVERVEEMRVAGCKVERRG